MDSTLSDPAPGTPLRAGRTMVAARLFEGALARATDGYTLGYAGDVILDLRTGHIAYALLALDEREHARLFTAVPWRYVTLDADGTGLQVALSSATVRRAPAIDLDGWLATPEPAWETAILRHYEADDGPREHSLAEELGLRSPIRFTRGTL